MKILKQSSLLCVCASDSCPVDAGRVAETESADHRACRATGGHEVSRVSLVCRDHRASAVKPAKRASLESKAQKATLACRESLAQRATLASKARRAIPACKATLAPLACKAQRATPDRSGLMSLS